MSTVRDGVRDVMLRAGLLYPVRNLLHGRGAAVLAQAQFYRAILEPGATVFDVGANIGNRTALYADAGCRVIALEPQPLSARHLRYRFRFTRRVTVVEMGAADRAGTRTLFECRSDVLSSMSRKHIDTVSRTRFAGETWNAGISVRTTTLDELIARFGTPMFVKVDVEGYEPNVLRGLSAPIDLLSFEFTAETIDETIECVERLRTIDRSYVFNYCDGEDLRFRRREHLDARTFLDSALNRMTQPDAWGDVYALREHAVRRVNATPALFAANA
jgi:FkbM family methyltransferase